MAVKKENFPKLTFRPTEKNKKEFRKKCFRQGITHDKALNELLCCWLSGKIILPG